MSGSDAGFSVEGRDWPAKVNYFDKQQTSKRANAPHQGRPTVPVQKDNTEPRHLSASEEPLI